MVRRFQAARNAQLQHDPSVGSSILLIRVSPLHVLLVVRVEVRHGEDLHVELLVWGLRPLYRVTSRPEYWCRPSDVMDTATAGNSGSAEEARDPGMNLDCVDGPAGRGRPFSTI